LTEFAVLASSIGYQRHVGVRHFTVSLVPVTSYVVIVGDKFDASFGSGVYVDY